MKKNRLFNILRVVLALAVWFFIYKCYEVVVDSRLDGVLPEIVRMIINGMVIPYTVGLGACYLILRGMEVPEKSSTNVSAVNVPDLAEKKIAVTPVLIIKAFLVQMGLSMPVILISNMILNIFGIMPHGMTADQVFGKYRLFYIILLLGFAPVMEEVLFRKLFLDRLLVIGETGAIIVSAVLFGLPHAFSQGIPQMLGTFLIGLVWAYVRVRTGKLWPGIILHIMFNLYGCYFAIFMTQTSVTAVGFMFLSVILLPVAASLLLTKHFETKSIKEYNINTR